MAEQVLIIGGGVAGMAAATTLGDAGFDVHLVEREASIGGRVNLLCCKATDVCTRCSVCLGHKKVREVSTHSRISILTHASLSKLEGEAGCFLVEIREHSPYVDPQRCVACGICTDVCPTRPQAIHPPSPEAFPYCYAIDEGLCLRFGGEDCDLCRQKCPTDAVGFDRHPRKLDLSVAAVIVATGADVFDAKQLGGLGYGRHKGVLTGLDLEKRLNRQGRLGEETDEAPPRSVAFVQCVGSRSSTYGYCSQACCKYAMRLSLLIKHQYPATEVTIFYIDLQNAGKGFVPFYEACQEKIRFIQGIPVEVSEAHGGQLEVRFENIAQSRVEREQFDMVVLSVGMVPAKGSWNVASVLGIGTDEFGFFNSAAQGCSPVETNVEGVLLAGACQGPQDIPDSIAQGIAAAERAMEVIGTCQGTRPSFSAIAERA